MKAEYAVRGAIVIRAMEHEKALAAGEWRPFKKIVYCNIGNPHQLGQPPLSFHREVLALCNIPHLLDRPDLNNFFADDAIERARKYLASIPGGMGAYSQSQGIDIARQECADFISERDGHPANPNDIFLTNGASSAVRVISPYAINISHFMCCF